MSDSEQEPNRSISFSQVSRVSKIKNALKIDNSENINPFITRVPEVLSEQGAKLQQSYAEQKRKSKERSTSRQNPEKVSVPTIQQNSSFSQKYQKLEENFKKFASSISSEPSIENKPENVIKLLGFNYQGSERVIKTSVSSDRIQSLQSMLRDLQKFMKKSVTQIQQASDMHFDDFSQLNWDLPIDKSRVLSGQLKQSNSHELDQLNRILGSCVNEASQTITTAFKAPTKRNRLSNKVIAETLQVKIDQLLPAILNSIKSNRLKTAIAFCDKVLGQLSLIAMRKSFTKWLESPSRKLRLQTLVRHIANRSRLALESHALIQWQLLTKKAVSITEVMFLNDENLRSDYELLSQLNRSIQSIYGYKCDAVLQEDNQVKMVRDGSIVKATLVQSLTRKAIESGTKVCASSLIASKFYEESVDRPPADISESLQAVILPSKVSSVVVRLFSAQTDTRLVDRIYKDVEAVLQRIMLQRELLNDANQNLGVMLDQEEKVAVEQKVLSKLMGLVQNMHDGDLTIFVRSVIQCAQTVFESVCSFDGKVDSLVFQDKVMWKSSFPDLQIGIQSGVQQVYLESSPIIRLVVVQSGDIRTVFVTECTKTEICPNSENGLMLFANKLQSVITHGLRIHEDFAAQLASQQLELDSQILSKKLRQQLINDLSTLRSQKQLTESLWSLFTQICEPIQMAVVLAEKLICQESSSNDLVGHLSHEEQLLILGIARDSDRYPPDLFKTTSHSFQYHETHSLLKFPIYSNDNQFMTAFIAVSLNCTLEQVQFIKIQAYAIIEELQSILNREFENVTRLQSYSRALDSIKDKIVSLQIDIDFMQAVQNLLVLPFTKSPSLKTIGHCLHHLTQHTLPMITVDSVQLYVQGILINSDIRYMQFISTGEKLEGESLVQMQSGSNLRLLLPSANERVILINMMIPDPSLVHQLEIYQQIIAPFVALAIESLTDSMLPVKQEHLPRVVESVVQKRKSAYTVTFLSALKELHSSQVPIFTRLNSFRKAAHHRSVGDLEQTVDSEHQKRKHALSTYTRVFSNLNKVCLKVKKRAFECYKSVVCDLLSYEQSLLTSWALYRPTKQQRKAFSLIAHLAKRQKLKETFIKLAIKTKMFRKLNNPQSKKLGAAYCLLHNHLQLNLNLSFQKLRGNSQERCYRDFTGISTKDRDFFVQLQRRMLETIPQISGHNALEQVECAFTGLLEQAVIYLQKTLLPESLDVIICTLRQSRSKYRAYLFNKAQDRPIEDQFDLTTDLQQLQDFSISLSHDVILQMLQRSNSIFNFTDISSSLLGLYTSQHGRQPSDPDLKSRITLLKKSRSAMVCPLKSESADECQLIGSLELYRFHGQTFDQEFEARMQTFIEQLQESFKLFLNMKQTQLQVAEFKQDLAECGLPIKCFSTLLRQFQAKATKLNADSLRCIIVNENTGQASFLQNETLYNFSYEGSVIDDVLESECVLELQAQNDSHALLDLSESTSRINESGQSTHRMLQIEGMLNTIAGEGGFRRLYYYPVLCDFVVAVVEVAFKRQDQAPTNPLNQSSTTLCDQLRSQLCAILMRHRRLCSSVEHIVHKNWTISKQAYFAIWKQLTQLQAKQQHFQTKQNEIIVSTQQCLDDYLQNLECYDKELRKLAQINEVLSAESKALNVDRQTKFKLLATCMLILNRMTKQQKMRQKNLAFSRWKSNTTVSKVIEAAFNKMLKLNYQHANQRFHAAAYLLKKSYIYRLKKVAFDNVNCFAKLTQLGGGGDVRWNPNTSVVIDSAIKSGSGCLSNYRSSMGGGNPIILSCDQTFSNIVGPFQRTTLEQNHFGSGKATPINIKISDANLASKHASLENKKSRKKSNGKSAPQMERIYVK